MLRVARVLVNFVDGSYLYVDLSKKSETKDSLLFCSKIVGLPEGSPDDKPSIALSINRTAKAGDNLGMIIPMSRINCINVLEEFLNKDVPKDIEELWK